MLIGIFASFLLILGFVNAVECGDEIRENTVLDKDLIDCPGIGLTVYSSIILDCNGHIIDGVNGSSSRGIFLPNTHYSTVKNCYIQEFNSCLSFNDAASNSIAYNSFSNCNYGIISEMDSGGNKIWDNSFWYNVYNGYEERNSNNWDDEGRGNRWDDFEDNPGYPDYYEIPGPGSGIDWFPRQIFLTDLTLSNEDIIFSSDTVREGENVTITAFFYQTLQIDPDEIYVEFYDGNPLEDGVLIGSDLIVIEEISSSFFAQTEWEAVGPVGDREIYVYLDPDNVIEEVVEINNIAHNSVFVEVIPDLMIREEDISFTNLHPRAGDEIDILAMVHNIEESIPTGEFVVSFYLDNIRHLIAEVNLSLGPESTETLIVPWTAVEGYHNIIVKVDSNNAVEEQNEENNEASQLISVNKPYIGPGGGVSRIVRPL